MGEWPDLMMFLVEDGRRIVVDPLPGVDERFVRSILLGPVMGILLRQRNLLPLHASSVMIEHGAVAFVGDAGMGKSTLAQAFFAQGFGVVADDITALRFSLNSVPLVVPGYPQLKLCPDAVERFVEADLPLPALHAATTKQAHRILERFPRDPVPLRKIYVLAVGDEHYIEPIKPADAFPIILQHTRAIQLVDGAKYIASHFQQTTQLIKQIPIARFVRKRSLEEVPACVKRVQDDLELEDDRLAA